VATETIDSNRFVSKFRGPGCMAKYLVAHPEQRPTVFVTELQHGQDDGAGPGVLRPRAGGPEYRRGRIPRLSPAAAAVAFASETRALPIAWNEVLERAR
jgi:hypothetical protein